MLTLILALVLPLALALPAAAQPRNLPDRARDNIPDHVLDRIPDLPDQARDRMNRGNGNGNGNGNANRPFPPDQARERVPDLPEPAQRVFCNVPDDRIGVQLWTVRGLMSEDPEGTLAAIADIGYQNVEPFSFHGLSAEEFAELLDRYGLDAPAMHININTLQNNPEQIAEDLQTIGAETGVIAFVGSEWRTEEGVQELVQVLNEGAEALAEHGLNLAYHNHAFEFETEVFGQTMFDYLVQNTENVDIELDIYWAVAGGADPAELVEQYGDRITLLHVKDMDTEGAFEDVGEGIIDFCEVFQQQRFDYYFVENDRPGDDPIAAIRTSYENLRNLDFQQAD